MPYEHPSPNPQFPQLHDPPALWAALHCAIPPHSLGWGQEVEAEWGEGNPETSAAGAAAAAGAIGESGGLMRAQGPQINLLQAMCCMGHQLDSPVIYFVKYNHR